MFRATVHLTFSFTVLWCGQVGACLSKQLVRKQEGIQQFRAKVDTFKEQAAVKAGKFFKVQHLVEKIILQQLMLQHKFFRAAVS